MRIEEHREFAIPPKKMWDYLVDFRQWPMWYAGMAEVVDPDLASWTKEGDAARVIMKVLGRKLEYLCTLEEWVEYELSAFRVETPSLPVAHHRWLHTPLGGDRLAVDVTVETEDATSFFGSILDKGVMPSIHRKYLVRSLENLEDLVAAGLPD